MVFPNIIRVIDKNKQVALLSVLETMFTLKKSWDEISKKTFQNCFRNTVIATQSQESAMDENVDTFKEILCNDEDLLVELEFDLNQLCEVNSELAPANLSANGLLDIDADIGTNNSQPLTMMTQTKGRKRNDYNTPTIAQAR